MTPKVIDQKFREDKLRLLMMVQQNQRDANALIRPYMSEDDQIKSLLQEGVKDIEDSKRNRETILSWTKK